MSDNPYLDRKTKMRIGHNGRKSEKSLARRLGADMTPASGATRAKGDMQLGEFLIEAKSSICGSMVLQKDWFAKIDHEASMVGKTPALAITFTYPMGGALPGGEWVAIPLDVFKEFVK